MIIFLDESGDLGLDLAKAGTSRTFVITLLVCNGRDVSQRFKVAIRRTLKNKIHRNKSAAEIRELKGSETVKGIKTYFFRHLPAVGWCLYTVVLDKQQLKASLDRPLEKRKIYNFLARYILERIEYAGIADAVTLVVDRSKGKDDIREFNEYVRNHLEGLLPLKVRLDIYHEHSHASHGLQAVDLFCWGIFKKFEADDSEWYEVFKTCIAGEYLYPEPGQ